MDFIFSFRDGRSVTVRHALTPQVYTYITTGKNRLGRIYVDGAFYGGSLADKEVVTIIDECCAGLKGRVRASRPAIASAVLRALAGQDLCAVYDAKIKQICRQLNLYPSQLRLAA